MVMMLRQCCCGCTLKTGTIIIGILNAIGSAYSFIGGIVVASAAEIITIDPNNPKHEDFESLTDTIKAVMIVITVIAAILFIVSVCLIAGAVYENPVLLMPWLVYTCIYIIVNLILYIVSGATYISADMGASAASNFVSAILFVLLDGYFLLVVYSLYRELKGIAPSPA